MQDGKITATKVDMLLYVMDIKEKIILRNDVINFNENESEKESDIKLKNYLYHPRNILWGNTIDILNLNFRINNVDLHNVNETIINGNLNDCNFEFDYYDNENDKHNYFELIKFSEDFKIFDVFNLKEKQDKLIFNNLK